MTTPMTSMVSTAKKRKYALLRCMVRRDWCFHARRVRYPELCNQHVNSFGRFLWFRAFRRDDELLSHFQLAGIVDMIRSQELVVRDLEFLGDRHRVVALRHDVNFAAVRN